MIYVETMTLEEEALEADWLDEWADDDGPVERRQAARALQDDTCDACRMDIYEGEPVFNTDDGLVHEGCLDTEGNVW